MDTQWIIWLIVAIVLLVISFIFFILYRKKKQYDFFLKMMQQQKKREELAQQEQAFVEKRAAMSSEEAAQIIELLGGQGNIVEIEQNAIRIRVQVKDKKLVDERALRVVGVSGIIKTARGFQLIIGDRADQVAAEMKAIVEQS